MFVENPLDSSFFHRLAANDAGSAARALPERQEARDRTVPIPDTLTPVPGYPQKLVVFKMAASRFWQVRCWVEGRTHRRSTQTQSLRLAQSFARRFYEQLMAQRHAGVLGAALRQASFDTSGQAALRQASFDTSGQAALRQASFGTSGQAALRQAQGERRWDGPSIPQGERRGEGSEWRGEASERRREASDRNGGGRRAQAALFSALASQVLLSEKARTQRGEFSLGSWQVLKNRLDAHILPRWGECLPQEINYLALLDFTQALSQRFSSTTVSQYLVAVRKVLMYAVATGVLDKLPEFPKIKIHTTSRGAFTPSEYWKIIRCARRLRGQQHPQSTQEIRISYKIRRAEQTLPPDMAWAIGFMLNSFIRPSDLKTLQHRHVEIVRANHTYLRLTLPETKRHGKPIVTMRPAVRIYEQICKHQGPAGLAGPDDYLFLPHLKDRNYAHWVLNFHFNWVLAQTGLKKGPHGQPRSLYSLRHSSITFRLLYGQGIDLLTLARNARTSVDVINKHYASTVTGEQNIALLQSRRRVEMRSTAG